METKTTTGDSLQADTVVGKKHPYQAPKLLTYGAVRQFTQGTGGGGNDGGGIMTMMSDPACKTNCVRVGTHALGVGLYLFDYKPEFQAWSGYGRQFGVMADEVETVMPDAVVVHADGYKRVNYTMLGIDLSVCSLH